jgi:hypothetical protein
MIKKYLEVNKKKKEPKKKRKGGMTEQVNRMWGRKEEKEIWTWNFKRKKRVAKKKLIKAGNRQRTEDGTHKLLVEEQLTTKNR